MGVRTVVCQMLLPSLVLGVCTLTLAQGQQSSAGQADNTRMNRQNEPTADQQKNAHSDRDITQQIRNSITHDKSLSAYGRNVKVITQDGQVTLKGPVRSEEEKKSIESKAAEVAGADHVSSELDVQGKH